jgi:hypothetical protein
MKNTIPDPLRRTSPLLLHRIAAAGTDYAAFFAEFVVLFI